MGKLAAKRNITLGIALMLVYALAMVISDSFAKHLSATISVIVIVWYRYLFHTLTIVVLTTVLRISTDHKETVGNPVLQFLRGLFLVLSTCAFFASLAQIPLAEAMGLLYIFPIISVILSALFLKEKTSGLQKLLILIGFLGVLLVLDISVSGYVLPQFLALAGGLCMGVYMFLTKLMSSEATPLVSSLYSGSVGIFLIPFLPGFEFVLLESPYLFLAISMGILAAVGHFCMVLSMRQAPSSIVSPFAFFEVVFAALVGLLWFNELLSVTSILGILMIVFTGLVFAIHSQKRNQLQNELPS